MREFLIACNNDDWDLGYDQWPDAFRPATLPYRRLDGVQYRIEINGTPVYFADEMPGIQIAIEGDLPDETAQKLAAEVLQNLERITRQRGRVISLG